MDRARDTLQGLLVQDRDALVAVEAARSLIAASNASAATVLKGPVEGIRKATSEFAAANVGGEYAVRGKYAVFSFTAGYALIFCRPH